MSYSVQWTSNEVSPFDPSPNTRGLLSVQLKFHRDLATRPFSRPLNDNGEDSDIDLEDGLPPGWESAETYEEDVYYARADDSDPDKGTTIRVRPTSGMTYEATRAHVLERLDPESLEKSDGKLLEESSPRASQTFLQSDSSSASGPKPRSRCSIFTNGRLICEDEDQPSKVVAMLRSTKQEDSICIVENINDNLIQAFRDAKELDLPYDFFIRSRSIARPNCPPGHTTYARRMDDIAERALSLEMSVLKKEKDKSIRKVIDTIFNAGEVVKTHVDSWLLCGGSDGEIECVSSCVSKCEKLFANLKQMTASKSKASAVPVKELSDNISTQVRALRRQTLDLNFLRLRRFFNIYATYGHEEDDPQEESLRKPKTNRSNLKVNDGTPKSYYGRKFRLDHLDTHVSYARVDKSLCLILVDSPPLAGDWEPFGAERSRILAHFPHALAGRGMVFPELLELQTSSLYDAFKIFAAGAWRAEILCGEQKLPPTFQEFLEHKRSQRDRPTPSRAKLHTALDPQAFLLMLSSFLWERNLQCLERKIDHNSFRRLRNANTMGDMSAINNILHDSREDLKILVGQVEHTLTNMPSYLASYYDSFPRIRYRHQATHFSPVAHLPEILKRANKLEKLILDDFQILMSTMSVLEGHESTNQPKLATGVAILAFIYVPLTLVTGIFGMNIKDQEGFVWWAPLAALATVVLITAGLITIVRFSLAAWRGWRRSRASPDKLKKISRLASALPNRVRSQRTASSDEEAANAKNE